MSQVVEILPHGSQADQWHADYMKNSGEDSMIGISNDLWGNQ